MLCPFRLDGIPIAYSNKFTFAQSAGAIMDDCPYIHFVVVVDCVVFQPKIGSLLSGKNPGIKKEIFEFRKLGAI